MMTSFPILMSLSVIVCLNWINTAIINKGADQHFEIESNFLALSFITLANPDLSRDIHHCQDTDPPTRLIVQHLFIGPIIDPQVTPKSTRHTHIHC